MISALLQNLLVIDHQDVLLIYHINNNTAAYGAVNTMCDLSNAIRQREGFWRNTHYADFFLKGHCEEKVKLCAFDLLSLASMTITPCLSS